MKRLLPLALAGIAAACGQRDPGPPNLLLIVSDDLGWADLGGHGGEIRTPSLDRIAAEGVELERFYAFPLCSPSRAALLTGRSPFGYGLGLNVVRPWSRNALAAEERLLPELLAAAGYETALVGKWHLGHGRPERAPQARGFEHFYGCLNGAVDYFTHTREGGLDWQRDGQSLREEGYATDLIAAEAVRLIEERDRERPLFLMVAFTAPHIPLQVPETWAQPYRHLEPAPRRIYAGMVAALDAAVGRILDALGDEDMAENTLVVFFNDNGGDPDEGASNLPLRGGKGTAWEGGIRVRAAMRWPGRLEAGGKHGGPLSVLDLFPTLLAALGLEPAGIALDGRNQWPAVAEGAAAPDFAFVVGVEDARGTRYGALDGEWKLVIDMPRRRRQARAQLYHLPTDPAEQADRLAEQPEVVKRLQQGIEAARRSRPPGAFRFSTAAPRGWTAPPDWSMPFLK